MGYSDLQKRGHVYQMQTALYELGKSGMNLPRVNPDGVYGPETTAAVREFQRIVKLPPTGKVDRETWDRLFELYFGELRVSNTPLGITPFVTGPLDIRRGQTGSGIGMAQVMINVLSQVLTNLKPVPITFIYDDATITQMREIRRLNQLPESDVLDVEAWNGLVILYNLAASQGL